LRWLLSTDIPIAIFVWIAHPEIPTLTLLVGLIAEEKFVYVATAFQVRIEEASKTLVLQVRF
jgi:hypothetical protein